MMQSHKNYWPLIPGRNLPPPGIKGLGLDKGFFFLLLGS